MEAGPGGLSAGVLSGRLGIASSSLSFHLQVLVDAGLVSQRRVGRQIIYAMVPGAVNALVAFLTENCCGRPGGAAAACAPGCVPADEAATSMEKAS